VTKAGDAVAKGSCSDGLWVRGCAPRQPASLLLIIPVDLRSTFYFFKAMLRSVARAV